MDYKFSYAILTSRFIDYFNIDVSNGIVDFTKASNEKTERHLKKLGMSYVDHEWVMEGQQPATTNVDLMEEESEEETRQEPDLQWNPFESLMIQKMNAIIHLHQKHQAEVHNSLENITTKLENIETRLSLCNFLNPNEDKA